MRPEAGFLLRRGHVPDPEVGEREIALPERGLDEARDALEREPEFVVDEGESERNARPVQRGNAVSERLEHRLPQNAWHVHVALEAEVSDEVVYVTDFERRPAEFAFHVQCGAERPPVLEALDV